MQQFAYLGVRIDETQNQGYVLVISQGDSAINVLVIPTDEEIVIARDTYQHFSH